MSESLKKSSRKDLETINFIPNPQYFLANQYISQESSSQYIAQQDQTNLKLTKIIEQIGDINPLDQPSQRCSSCPQKADFQIERTPFCTNCALSFSLKNSAICNPIEIKKLELIENFEISLEEQSSTIKKLVSKIQKKNLEIKNSFEKKQDQTDQFFESLIEEIKKQKKAASHKIEEEMEHFDGMIDTVKGDVEQAFGEIKEIQLDISQNFKEIILNMDVSPFQEIMDTYKNKMQEIVQDLPEFEKDLENLKNVEIFSSKNTKDSMFSDLKMLFNCAYHTTCGSSVPKSPIFQQSPQIYSRKKSLKNLEIFSKQKSCKKLLYHLQNKNRSADDLRLKSRGSSVARDSKVTKVKDYLKNETKIQKNQLLEYFKNTNHSNKNESQDQENTIDEGLHSMTDFSNAHQAPSLSVAPKKVKNKYSINDLSGIPKSPHQANKTQRRQNNILRKSRSSSAIREVIDQTKKNQEKNFSKILKEKLSSRNNRATSISRRSNSRSGISSPTLKKKKTSFKSRNKMQGFNGLKKLKKQKEKEKEKENIEFSQTGNTYIWSGKRRLSVMVSARTANGNKRKHGFEYLNVDNKAKRITGGYDKKNSNLNFNRK